MRRQPLQEEHYVATAEPLSALDHIAATDIDQRIRAHSVANPSTNSASINLLDDRHATIGSAQGKIGFEPRGSAKGCLLEFAVNMQRFYLEADVLVHLPDREQGCHAMVLQDFIRNFEFVFFEVKALGLTFQLLRGQYQARDHGESITATASSNAFALHFDGLVASQDITVDLVAELWRQIE